MRSSLHIRSAISSEPSLRPKKPKGKQPRFCNIRFAVGTQVILRESIEIDRPPPQVWDVIENPETMKQWSPKVKNVVLENWGARGTGFRYRIIYALSGQPSELDAEIQEYRPPARLGIKLTGGHLPRTDYVYETYELSPTAGGTRLEQTIEIHDSHIPLFFRVLIWFMRRFGQPTGKSYLAGVKALAEGATAS